MTHLIRDNVFPGHIQRTIFLSEQLKDELLFLQLQLSQWHKIVNRITRFLGESICLAAGKRFNYILPRRNLSFAQQASRPSVICENPIYRSNKREQEKQSEEPMNVDNKSDDEDEDIIVVDEEEAPQRYDSAPTFPVQVFFHLKAKEYRDQYVS